MRVYGIDFTSRPTRRNPITCAVCRLDGGVLVLDELRTFPDFAGFEALLGSPGPWIAGMVFPFGLSRRFIEGVGWPRHWTGYAGLVGGMDRATFHQLLDTYRAPRPPGDREHRRVVDALAGSISPQKLHGVPVALMFFEGVPRLLASQASIPPVRPTADDRIIVEAYSGVLARRLIGRRSYKQDDGRRLTADQHAARVALLAGLTNVDAPADLVADATGDRLDALLCAVQAAWGWSRREASFGIPANADPLEGWIVDESLSEAAA